MSIKITEVDGYRKVTISPNAKRKGFEVCRCDFDYDHRPFIVVCEGFIIEAGRSSDNNNYDIKDAAPNWKKAAETLDYFIDADIKVFYEVLEMLDKNTEEYKNIKFYLEVIFSKRRNEAKSNLEKELLTLGSVSKRL